MENNATESSSRQCRRILLVEDYEVNQQFAQLILQKAGFHVDVVANGQQAFEAYQQNRYDLILMDIQMPVMDGHEATKRIRNWEDGVRSEIENNSDSTSDFQLPYSDFKRVPIIAMTGDASEGAFDPERYPGMNDCICKPLQRDRLLSALNRWTDPASNGALDQRPAPENEIGTPVIKPGETDFPLDLDRALDEFMGNKKILYAVLDEFINRAADQIIALRQAIGGADYGVIASEAHSIKGGAANLTAGRLSRAASDMEKAALSKNKIEIQKLIVNLEEEFHHLERYLRQTVL